MRYMVVIEKGEMSCGAYVPDLADCAQLAKPKKQFMSKHLTLIKQLLLILLLILFFYCENRSQIRRYPNEISSFRLFTDSKLEQLEPLVSTKQDVRKVFDEVYQGKCDWKYINEDAENVCELSDRKIIIGFVYQNSNSYKKGAWEKLKYVRVIPKINLFFKESDFKGKYKKGVGGMSHPETSFDVYYDEYGLSYQVIKKSINPDLEAGTLFQITYSYSKKNYKKYIKNK